MRAVHTYSTDSIKRYNKRFKVLAVLDIGTYRVGERTCFLAAALVASGYGKQVVSCDINIYNSVYDVTCFFHLGCCAALRIMRAAGAVGVKMIFRMIRG